MSARARARLDAMRGAPTPKARLTAAAAGRLASAIRRQNVRVAARSRVGRSRRRNAATAGFLGIEVKYYDTTFAATVLATATTPGNTFRVNPAVDLCLNAVKQGDGPTNRDGKKIRLRSIYIKGTVYREGIEGKSVTQEPVSAYVACVLDRQANASEIAPAQVYVNPSLASIGCNNMFRNLEYSDRYRILRDQVFNFGSGPLGLFSGVSVATGGQQKHFEWFIPCNFDTLFNTVAPTTATIADIVSNAVGMIGCATANDATNGNQIALAYNARIRFVG